MRCIRPNELKSPDQFQPEKVLIQLRYTGILETTRIRKEVCVCSCVHMCMLHIWTLQELKSPEAAASETNGKCYGHRLMANNSLVPRP